MHACERAQHGVGGPAVRWGLRRPNGAAAARLDAVSGWPQGAVDGAVEGAVDGAVDGPVEGTVEKAMEGARRAGVPRAAEGRPPRRRTRVATWPYRAPRR